MDHFTMIVSICSGLMVISGFVMALVKPIREKITKVKEREAKEKELIDGFKAEVQAVKGDIKDVRDDIGDLRKEVDGVRSDAKEDKAERARTQILRFADEMYQGQKHTKEHFDEILAQITYYQKYCEEHPSFENNRTDLAQKHIQHVYNTCLQEHTFLAQERRDDE